MSGGSSDDAVLAIAHFDAERRVAVLASPHVLRPAGRRSIRATAVRKFAAEIKAWGLRRVTGDAYAGQTFRRDFEALGISYTSRRRTKSDIYDALRAQLERGRGRAARRCQVARAATDARDRGAKIDHQPGDHDDFANAACGAITLAAERAPGEDEVFVAPFSPVHVSVGRGFESGLDTANSAQPPGGWRRDSLTPIGGFHDPSCH